MPDERQAAPAPARKPAAKPAPQRGPVAAPEPAPQPAPGGCTCGGGCPRCAPDQALKEAAQHPFISGLFSEVLADLRFGRDFSDKERAQLKLNGTEGAALWALVTAPALGGMGAGGYRFGRDPAQNLSITGKYFSALEPLSPSKSLATDIPSLVLGQRIDAYLASDTFAKRITDNLHTVAYLAAVAQIVWSTKVDMAPAEPDASGLTTDEGAQHAGLAVALAGLILKQKLMAPDLFDNPTLTTPTHPAYAQGPYAGGPLPQGLTVDSASGVGGATFQHFGGALNLPRLLGQDTAEDPLRYRGWQASAFGDYQRLVPTATQAQAGRVPEGRFRGGVLAGGNGLLALGEVGGQFSGAQADQLTTLFGSAGLAYAPAGGPLRKLGFKVTHLATLGDEAGADAAGATQLSPFVAADMGLGGGHSLALGGSAGLVVGPQGFHLGNATGSASYTYLGPQGSEALPTFKLTLEGSAQRLDWQDAGSPLLYGVRAKTQTRQFFAGAQLNWGADQVDPARAAQLPDPRSDLPAPAGGTSVLVLAGFLTP